MDTITIPRKPGYFLIELVQQAHCAGQDLCSSNSQRAFIIAFLQDSLSCTQPGIKKQNLSEMTMSLDLLAFSIERKNISLLVFAFSYTTADYFACQLAAALSDFKQQNCTLNQRPSVPLTYHIESIPGPYLALHTSIVLHSRHHDWEYDRYSSIGFYIHDRPGSWMRPWRLTHLAQSPEAYRTMVEKFIQNSSHHSRNANAQSNLFENKKLYTEKLQTLFTLGS